MHGPHGSGRVEGGEQDWELFPPLKVKKNCLIF